MNIAAVANLTDYSVDQARRRIECLVGLGVVDRARVAREQNRWDYSKDCVKTLKKLKHLETKQRMTAKDAIALLKRERGADGRSCVDDRIVDCLEQMVSAVGGLCYEVRAIRIALDGLLPEKEPSVRARPSAGACVW
jgi:hypothetical protein